MAIGDTTRSRLVLFGGLYFAQGVSWGFVTVAVALRLTNLGLGAAAIGTLVGFSQIPWSFKPLLGPLVDRLSLGRRPLLLFAEAAMAVSLIVIAGLSPATAPVLFRVMLVAHNSFAALQDVTTDALAVERLPVVERGRANGVMAASKWAGTLVGGPALAAVSSKLGWPAACFAAVALLLLPATLALLLRERPPAPAPASLLGEGLRLFTVRVAVLAALFCLVSGGSDNFLYPVILPLFRRTLAFSEDQMTLLISISAASATVGSLAGGFLADRLGRRKTMAAGAVLLALVELAFVAAQPHWGRFSLIAGYQVVSSLASGVLFAATLAFCMDITNPRLAATHFQIYMALLNVRNTWAAFAGGHLADRLAAPTMFTLGAALELVPILLLLPFLDPRKAVYPR